LFYSILRNSVGSLPPPWQSSYLDKPCLAWLPENITSFVGRAHPDATCSALHILKPRLQTNSLSWFHSIPFHFPFLSFPCLPTQICVLRCLPPSHVVTPQWSRSQGTLLTYLLSMCHNTPYHKVSTKYESHLTCSFHAQ
jgi:hypothetical protein